MDTYLLKHYKQFVKFLSIIMGKDFEIILYWIDQGQVSIAAIENNHISGRTLDSPITEFGMSLIKNKVYLKQDYVTQFNSINHKNVQLSSSTFFIKNENDTLFGMLGINHDQSKTHDIVQKLDEIKQLICPLTEETNNTDNQQDMSSNENWSTQILSDSIEEIVYSIVSPEIIHADVNLSQDLKVNIVRTLDQRGIFAMKGAVTTVADILQISEPSVYRYLKMIEKE